MNKTAKKWLTFTVRWGIAVAGIWIVLAKTPFYDQAMILRGDQLIRVRVIGDPPESAPTFTVIDPDGKTQTVDRDDVWTQPDNGKTAVHLDTRYIRVKLLAIRPGGHHAPNAPPAELLIQNPDTGKPQRISPDIVPGGYHIRIPYPLVDIGVVRLVKYADWRFLLAALAVLPFSYVVTSRRWHMLLNALDIHLTQWRTFVLNMVGCFYNSFMPGSTGGDLIKAYYASRHTPHKVRAILSVIVDRVVGLLALIVLGGVMASTQWSIPDCRRVAITCAVLLLMTAVGLVVFYRPGWRRASGLEWLLKRLPMQRQIHHAVEAMELYGKRPGALIVGGVMTFPVHFTTILSAIFAGYAFGLDMHKMPPVYYCTVVPVLVLVGAVPLSPQGAGVMEIFAVLLTRNQGVTVSQAIALAMAVRFGQMFWNLVAGLFVLRGGFHTLTAKEQEDLEADEGDDRDNGIATKSVAVLSQQEPASLAAQTNAMPMIEGA